MSGRVLIVEDEMLVAADMEATLEDLGYHTVGIASDTQTAMVMCQRAPDVALVDLNLRDGPTGPAIGAMLGDRGVAVVFVTANPRQLGPGVPGTLGCMGKPCDEAEIGAAVSYALHRQSGQVMRPPAGMSLFDERH